MASIVSVNSPSHTKANLICFHHVGGNGNSFRFLSKHLQECGIKLFLASVPGRNGKNANQLLSSVDEMAESLLSKMKELPALAMADVPLVFFGHSLGAITAFEVMLKLEATLLFPMSLLIVSSAKSPEELTIENKSRHARQCFHYNQNNEMLMAYMKELGGNLFKY
jgi:medium-chain acyl-[acyl-carrier-protein] hydrolase